MELILSFIEQWGQIAGWLVALLQLVIWIIYIPITLHRRHKMRKQIENLQNELEFWKEEASIANNRSNDWYNVLKHALFVLKDRAPKSYSKFIDSYGGEDEFKDMYRLPELKED